MERLLSYIKNSTNGKLYGAIGIISILFGTYFLIEFINSNKKEEVVGNVQMKNISGTDKTSIVDKEKQLSIYMEEEKERSKGQDFYIKTAYYLNDQDKRDFDGQTLNTKDFELTMDEKKNEIEDSIEGKEIKTINTEEDLEKERKRLEDLERQRKENEKKLRKDLIDSLLNCNEGCVKKLIDKSIYENKSIEELEKLLEECLANQKKCLEDKDNSEKENLLKKKLDYWDLEPNLSQMEPEAVLQYKNSRLNLLAQMVPNSYATNTATIVSVSKPVVETELKENNNMGFVSNIKILPGSSFYGTLQNNINSLSGNNIALIEFKSNELKGYKAIGQTKTNANGESMSIDINQIVDPQGNRITVQAFAIDSEKMSATFSDDTNSKAFKRIGLTAASILTNAFGTAKIASQQSGQTQTMSQLGMVATTTPKQDFDELFQGNIAQQTGTHLDQYLLEELRNARNEVKVNAGKDLIIIFH